jgi:hypothetical protein
VKREKAEHFVVGREKSQKKLESRTEIFVLRFFFFAFIAALNKSHCKHQLHSSSQHATRRSRKN